MKSHAIQDRPNFLEAGEYNAIAATGMLWDSAQAAEQKNGYLA
jgi:methane monooxygenase component A alpha chain